MPPGYGFNMTPLLHPFLVNDRFGDPALYVEFLFEKRALLFDLGDLHKLATRSLLRVSDIFVSHTHIDHFIGFDQVLRVLIGRDKHLRLFGPAGFIGRVAGKLSGYTWNLVDRYSADLVLSVTEVHSASQARTATLRLSGAFRREAEGELKLENGLIVDDGLLRLRAAVLDHRVPCLAFAVEEQAHVNVWKNRLDDLGLPTGPWLRALKQAVLRGVPDEAPFRVWWREAGATRERHLPLGRLKRDVLEIVPGQKIGYVTDVRHSPENRDRIVDLVHGADTLFIEAAFARADRAQAAERCHLTTEQAGRIARRAGVRRLEPFHFSPRYAGQEDRLRREAEEAFRGAEA